MKVSDGFRKYLVNRVFRTCLKKPKIPYIRNQNFVYTEIFFRIYRKNFSYIQKYFSVRTKISLCICGVFSSLKKGRESFLIEPLQMFLSLGSFPPNFLPLYVRKGYARQCFVRNSYRGC